jgi:hypothetical protein
MGEVFDNVTTRDAGASKKEREVADRMERELENPGFRPQRSRPADETAWKGRPTDDAYRRR